MTLEEVVKFLNDLGISKKADDEYQNQGFPQTPFDIEAYNKIRYNFLLAKRSEIKCKLAQENVNVYNSQDDIICLLQKIEDALIEFKEVIGKIETYE